MSRRAEWIRDQLAASAASPKAFRMTENHLRALDRDGSARLRAADFGYPRPRPAPVAPAPAGAPGGLLLADYHARRQNRKKSPEGGEK